VKSTTYEAPHYVVMVGIDEISYWRVCTKSYQTDLNLDLYCFNTWDLNLIHWISQKWLIVKRNKNTI